MQDATVKEEEVMEKKSCYNCQHFSLCRVRDRAESFALVSNSL